MPSGHKSNGVDLDDIFDPYVEGTKPASTGYLVAGFDLKDRYAPLSFGSSAPATGMRVLGADLNTIFAAAGTAVYQGVDQALQPGYNVLILPGWSGSSGLDYTYRLKSDGTATADRGPTDGADTFNWTTDGNPPIKAYEARLINVVEGGDAVWQFFNDASAWSTLNSTTSRTICRFRYNATTSGGESKSVTARLQIREAVSGTVVYDEVFTADATAGF